jgi:hypothetical protein
MKPITLTKCIFKIEKKATSHVNPGNTLFHSKRYTYINSNEDCSCVHFHKMNLTIKVEHENENKKESTINYLLSTIYYILYTIHIREYHRKTGGLT